ncbi:MAG: hypothetical protein KAU14_09835, partial [Thermoplasmata archaeon]|nr:hypothetical protein [Thermoplasmata archaeon]
LNQGKAAFMVELPGTGSKFTLQMAGGDKAVVDHGEKTVFRAEFSGRIWVFSGRVSYYPHEIGQGNPTMLKAHMTTRFDPNGTIFNHSLLHYSRALVTGIVTNSWGASMGFGNTGNFVATGELRGFVIRLPDEDCFYLYGKYSGFLSLDLTAHEAGRFDLHFLRYTTEPVGFTFKDMDTSPNTIFLRFQDDKAYVGGSSDLNYDMEISYKETSRFYLHDMTLYQGKGHSYKVFNYEHLSNPDEDSVIFGLDENGDEISEERVNIHSEMSGKDIYKALKGEKEEETHRLLLFTLVAILFILFMVLFFVAWKVDFNETFGTGPEISMEKEEILEEELEEEIPPGPERPIEEMPEEGIPSEAEIEEMPLEITHEEIPKEIKPAEMPREKERPKAVMEKRLMDLKESLILEEEYEPIKEEGLRDEEELPPLAPEVGPEEEAPPLEALIQADIDKGFQRIERLKKEIDEVMVKIEVDDWWSNWNEAMKHGLRSLEKKET